MTPVALSDVIAVGEVPTAAEIKILADAGFRSLLNTQPDDEVARLMPSKDIDALASAAGLTYTHVPIASRRPDEASLAAFAAAMSGLPRPIYACCYSGARAAAAWALSATAQHEPSAIIDACAKAGFDIAFLAPALEQRKSTPSQSAGAPPAVEAALEPLTRVPALQANVHVPRVASAGGFAVAG
jgi:sulfide:quinone oxidoreductase